MLQQGEFRKRLAQLPNMRCPELGKHKVQQLDKDVSLFFSTLEHARSPNVTLGPPNCVCESQL